jgi:3-hydroxyacyl-CoA dehydrogenase
MTGTVHIERDGDVAFLVIDNPPVNAGSRDIRKALLSAIETVEDDPSIAAAVLIGAGRTFVAGSDIREFDLPLDPPQLPAALAAIEGSSKPYVAALHGAALGGGYELALACDARIAAPDTQVGLPETTLGIVPGAGGTQKLPRLVGTAQAIALICSGARVGAETALSQGLIDEIAHDDLRASAKALAQSLVRSKRRVIARDVADADLEAVAAAEKKALAAGRNRPHIQSAISLVKLAGTVSAAEGLAAERAEFERLRVTPEAKALRHIFFAEREAARGRPDRKAKPIALSQLGVVGAGTMGAGIATAMLQAGYRTILVDTNADALSRAKARIEANLERGQKSGKLTPAAHDAARSNLALETDLDALADCDLVVEAIIEDMDAKRAVFEKLDAIAKPEAILATNTSYLDIDAMAAATSRPENVLGLHFFSPAHIMKLLEVVGGEKTSDTAMATGFQIAKRLSKQPVEAGNGFGFIGNRIYAAYRAACEFMLEEGALPHEIDAALTEFGFAMGPFAVADLSGLDIAWRMRQQKASTRDPSARYVEIPDKLCEAGRFGRKTAAGYYAYDENGKPSRDPEVEAIIIAASEAKGITRQTMAAHTIQARALKAIVSEAEQVLNEGIALRAGDIDVVLVNGYGFPRWTGGPLHWAGQRQAEQGAAQ